MTKVQSLKETTSFITLVQTIEVKKWMYDGGLAVTYCMDGLNHIQKINPIKLLSLLVQLGVCNDAENGIIFFEDGSTDLNSYFNTMFSNEDATNLIAATLSIANTIKLTQDHFWAANNRMSNLLNKIA